jgi:hypothetical protein
VRGTTGPEEGRGGKKGAGEASWGREGRETAWERGLFFLVDYYFLDDDDDKPLHPRDVNGLPSAGRGFYLFFSFSCLIQMHYLVVQVSLKFIT